MNSNLKSQVLVAPLRSRICGQGNLELPSLSSLRDLLPELSFSLSSIFLRMKWPHRRRRLRHNIFLPLSFRRGFSGENGESTWLTDWARGEKGRAYRPLTNANGLLRGTLIVIVIGLTCFKKERNSRFYHGRNVKLRAGSSCVTTLTNSRLQIGLKCANYDDPVK